MPLFRGTSRLNIGIDCCACIVSERGLESPRSSILRTVAYVGKRLHRVFIEKYNACRWMFFHRLHSSTTSQPVLSSLGMIFRVFLSLPPPLTTARTLHNYDKKG